MISFKFVTWISEATYWTYCTLLLQIKRVKKEYKHKFSLIFNKWYILTKSQSIMPCSVKFQNIVNRFWFFLGYQEHSTESFISTGKPLQKKHLVLYRTVMIPITTIISSMLAFIIARELRLHYFVSKATTTAKTTEKKYTNGVYIVWRNVWTIS